LRERVGWRGTTIGERKGGCCRCYRFDNPFILVTTANGTGAATSRDIPGRTATLAVGYSISAGLVVRIVAVRVIVLFAAPAFLVLLGPLLFFTLFSTAVLFLGRVARFRTRALGLFTGFSTFRRSGSIVRTRSDE
jgi:hypothetical protein